MPASPPSSTVRGCPPAASDSAAASRASSAARPTNRELVMRPPMAGLSALLPWAETPRPANPTQLLQRAADPARRGGPIAVGWGIRQPPYKPSPSSLSRPGRARHAAVVCAGQGQCGSHAERPAREAPDAGPAGHRR
jgi:hypothetical protein